MSSKHILNVFKQSLITFPSKPSSPDSFLNNFKKLKSLIDHLTSEHLNFDQTLLQAPELKGPCTYIQVYEDNNVNISIFVVRPGHKIPLHDHPRMHGLLKVIAGTIKIQAYNEDKVLTSKHHSSLGGDGNKPLIAHKLEEQICSAGSETCILTPENGNYHEIEPVEGPAAFLDVLSPPYEAEIPEFGKRDCSYYKVTSELGPHIVELSKIPVPSNFWCESAPYMGPHLMYLL